VVQLTTGFSQGSAATDLRDGDSFNSVFLCRSFLNLRVKKFAEVIIKIKVAYIFLSHGVKWCDVFIAFSTRQADFMK